MMLHDSIYHLYAKKFPFWFHCCDDTQSHLGPKVNTNIVMGRASCNIKYVCKLMLVLLVCTLVTATKVF